MRDIPLDFSKRKKWSLFRLQNAKNCLFFCTKYSTYMIFSKIFENFFLIWYFFQKISKIFGLEFFKLSKFLSRQIKILRLILENCLFLWNQSGFTAPLTQGGFKRFWRVFFLRKVSNPKNDQILAKIHHMLGFTWYPSERNLSSKLLSIHR